MIVKRADGFFVTSEEGKNLGGPYPTREEAEKRLAQVEKAKRAEGNLAHQKIEGVEIFAKGTWTDSQGRQMTFTDEDLDQMITNFDKVGAKVRPFLKIGHQARSGYTDAQNQEGTGEEAALGWVTRLWREGDKILADVSNVPRRLVQLAQAGAFPRVSSEITKVKDLAEGWILRAVALLGQSPPAIDTLEGLANLYTALDTGEEVHAFDQEVDLKNRQEDRTMSDDKRLEELMAQVQELKGQVQTFQAEKEALEGQVAERDESIQKLQGDLDARDVEARKEKAVQAFQAAVEKGRIPPVTRAHFEALIGTLAQDSTVVKFQAAEGEEEKDATGLEILIQAFSQMPAVARFGERFEATGNPGAEGDSEDVQAEVDHLVRSYQLQHEGTTYSKALEIVLHQNPALRERYGDPKHQARG